MPKAQSHGLRTYTANAIGDYTSLPRILVYYVNFHSRHSVSDKTLRSKLRSLNGYTARKMEEQQCSLGSNNRLRLD